MCFFLYSDGVLVGHISEADIVGIGPEAVEFVRSDEYLTIYDFMIALNKVFFCLFFCFFWNITDS